jgi:alpha-galactosidase
MSSSRPSPEVSELHEYGLSLRWSSSFGVILEGVDECALVVGHDVSLVEVFTANEQRARTSQNSVRSAVGGRLRYVEHRLVESEDARRLDVIQRDPQSDLLVTTALTRPRGSNSLHVIHTITNGSDSPVVLTGVTTAGVGIGRSQATLDDLDLVWGRSEWLAEGRWTQHPLREVVPELDLALHGQDGRGRFALTSHGSWSSGEFLPTGVVLDRVTGNAIAWQIETSSDWHFEFSQSRGGGVLSLLGPADKEHQFAHRLGPGDSFDSVPVSLAFSGEGRDGAFAEMTRHRRWLRTRWLRTGWLRPEGAESALPVIYNDFMNTLMGEPSTEKLLPLIDAAARAGAEYFCIDAGWFADPALGDWWSTVGEWREARGRFSGGLGEVIQHIHSRGMRSGLWLEPEGVGATSPVASTLPESAFFQRLGSRVREHDRFHLDLRHPAARQHLDDTLAYVVEELGVSYLKLDYNINPGPGTEVDATSASDGLLGHARAYRDWLIAAQRRYPWLLLENCSSGAMRADYALLAVTHLQSTSDQQNYRLYPAIAVSAPAWILPEQSGNWAYPSAGMSAEETTFSLVAGIVGRFYLSGFLDALSSEQQAQVAEAVAVHKDIRDDIADSVPFWPLGLPAWGADQLVLGLRSDSRTLVAVWSRAVEPTTYRLPGFVGQPRRLFPAVEPGNAWAASVAGGELVLDAPAGPTARVYEVRVASQVATASTNHSGRS